MTFHILKFHNPNWLSYFSEGFKPPTRISPQKAKHFGGCEYQGNFNHSFVQLECYPSNQTFWWTPYHGGPSNPADLGAFDDSLSNQRIRCYLWRFCFVSEGLAAMPVFFFHSFWFKSARSHHIFGSHRGRRCHFRLTDGVRSKSHGHCRRSLGFSVHHGRRALEPQDQTTGGLQSRNLAQGLCLVVLVGWLRGCLMFDIGVGFREFWGKSGRCWVPGWFWMTLNLLQ